MENSKWITLNYDVDIGCVTNEIAFHIGSATIRNPYDEGLKYLKSIKTLRLVSHNRFMEKHKICITDEGIKHLTNVHSLSIDCPVSIDGYPFKCMKRLHTLIFSGKGVINDDMMANIVNINTLIVKCRSVLTFTEYQNISS
jgi:hypothetical protein